MDIKDMTASEIGRNMLIEQVNVYFVNVDNYSHKYILTCANRTVLTLLILIVSRIFFIIFVWYISALKLEFRLKTVSKVVYTS